MYTLTLKSGVYLYRVVAGSIGYWVLQIGFHGSIKVYEGSQGVEKVSEMGSLEK